MSVSKLFAILGVCVVCVAPSRVANAQTMSKSQVKITTLANQSILGQINTYLDRDFKERREMIEISDTNPDYMLEVSVTEMDLASGEPSYTMEVVITSPLPIDSILGAIDNSHGCKLSESTRADLVKRLRKSGPQLLINHAWSDHDLEKMCHEAARTMVAVLQMIEAAKEGPPRP
jgi:hypothetical protein